MPVKNAISVETVYKSPRPELSMPATMRSAPVNLNTARQLASAMASVAPHGALDNTHVDFNGSRVSDIAARTSTNPRNSPADRYYAQFMDHPGAYGDEGSGLPPDKTQQLGDGYVIGADKVWLPSGNPAILAHELGHAIDLNGYPNTTPRMLLAGAYSRWTPKLWQEHAAWRKGEKALLQGSAKADLDPNTTVDTIEQIRRGRRYGLSTYYGPVIGGLLGLAGGSAAGFLGTAALNKLVGRPAFNNSTLKNTLIGGVAGLGAGTVIGEEVAPMVGQAWGDSESLGNDKSRQVYINQYAKVLAKQQGISFEEAVASIKKRLKPKSSKTPKEESKKPMKKSAGIELPSSVEEAAAILLTVKAAGIAARRDGTDLTKQAAGGIMDSLSGVGNQIKDYWGKLDPKVQNTMIGTGLGAGGGMLASLADDGNNFGLSALTGAAMGGLGTAAHQYLPGLAEKAVTPVDKPEDKPGFQVAAKDKDTDFGNKLEDTAGTLPRGLFELGMIVPDMIGRTAGTDVANISPDERISRAAGSFMRGAASPEGAAHIGASIATEGAAKAWRDRAALNDPAAIKRLNDNVASNPVTATHATPMGLAAQRAQTIVANKSPGFSGALGMVPHYITGGDVSRQILSAAATGAASKPRGLIERAGRFGGRQALTALMTNLALRGLQPEQQKQPQQ